MCLKIYHRFTFSNRDAFIRAKNKIRENYTYQPISGHIYILDADDPNFYLRERDDLPYNRLDRLALDDLICYEYVGILDWTTYNEVTKRVRDADVFGEFIIEMQ